MDLRPQRREIGADAGAARLAVRLIERAHAFQHRDMIAQPHVDLHRDAVGAVGLFAAIVEKARHRGEQRGDQYDETHAADGERQQPVRSEEHTSELQSLMRISYAVFWLTKKN